ncbi:hypothetical protein Lrub_1466 [Legionella rubrilucens]|uniref:Uncharacterized protein n=1 Tax=Legionella rubrilucens TaxID=458 RepID=A0A0W0XWP2_9GAMM|nr:hypothetical protein [Legionella rubrilucens]KTD49115.1 hypothetical protein Lrub_1466 [Legionella rubrilucens]
MLSKTGLFKQKHKGYRLNVSDYDTLVPYFFSKHKINLRYVVNGTTFIGRRMMAENYLQVQAEINEYENEQLAYARQIIHHWSPPNACMPGKYRLNRKNNKHSDFERHYQELYEAINDEFLNKDGQLKELSEEKQLRLNAIVKKLKCRKRLDEYRQKEIAELYERRNSVCLNKSQAIDEVKSIQKSLSDDEVVAYFFTNNRCKGTAHFETLLIKRDSIVKPVHWFLHESNMFESTDFDKFFITDLSPFVTFTLSKKDVEGGFDEDPMKRLQPQVDSDSCGTLGILYLKELLKNNSEQLREYSFVASLYSDKNDFGSIDEGRSYKSLLFFPSPHVLRYSQSRLYNSILLAMVQGTNDEEIIEYKHVQYKVKTLQGILKQSIAAAIEKDDPEAVRLKDLWSRFPDFRIKWINLYHKMDQKRQKMQDGSHNVYLTNKASSMQKILVDRAKTQTLGIKNDVASRSKVPPDTHEPPGSTSPKFMRHSNDKQSICKVSYNPLYQPRYSKSNLTSQMASSFFNPHEQVLIVYNPLYRKRGSGKISNAEESPIQLTEVKSRIC